MAESDTWEGRKNLENAKEAVEEYEKEYQQDMKDVRQQEREEEIFRRKELPGQFTAKTLFGWLDKRYDEEYWARLERNWRRWKEGKTRGQRTIETIKEEEEEIKQESSGIKEWTEEDNKEMGNMVDLYYEL